jgi:hypothetical protein
MSQVGYDWRGPDAFRQRPREEYEGVNLTRTVAAVVERSGVVEGVCGLRS